MTEETSARRTRLPAPVELFVSDVMHARMRPTEHRFTYRIFTMLIDLDRLEEAGRLSRIFSINHRNLISFHEKDHGNRDGTPLRNWAEKLLAEGGYAQPARLRLLTTPAVAGYTFNPLSIYYCDDVDGNTYALIYQVHNTFGETHAYVAGGSCDSKEPVMRHETQKEFYVSPFLPMDLNYRFRVKPPSDTFAVRILVDDAGDPVLSATMFGRKKKLTTANLLLGILATTGLSWKIMFGIHFEALRLWFKKVSLFPRTGVRNPVSYMSGRKNLADR